MKERGDNMRILVISDSHGQLGNLNEILKEQARRIEVFIWAMQLDRMRRFVKCAVVLYNCKRKLRFLFKE